jgi:hypothetical protein
LGDPRGWQVEPGTQPRGGARCTTASTTCPAACTTTSAASPAEALQGGQIALKLRNRLPRRQRALRRRRHRAVVEDALHHKPYHHGGNHAAERIPTRIVPMRRHGAWHDESKIVGGSGRRSGYRDRGRYDGYWCWCWCWRRCGRGGGLRRDPRAAVTNAGRSGKRHREQHAKQPAPAHCSTPHCHCGPTVICNRRAAHG